MDIRVRSFRELSKEELYNLLALRAEVFVVEQECAYQDLDGKDTKALHILGIVNNELIAYARVFGPGDYFEEASIGRIVVQKNYRSDGFGRQIVLAAEKAIVDNFRAEKIKLSAQSYLRNFYEDLGYRVKGDEYLEDGIPHLAMIKGG